ncbi:MAG: DUF427 domain-containing protein [Gemmatimonadetes bacterium]|uniref:DUF427 domain-containing protein n=1 Tax=Candidatus Kutchimonas denitrificans TaxID=3056748 RepID=A0AAE4Z907_9BACT|nr:DUF427 domain-containing protein [Gemmatimonadota bacterium]NIR74847.1 DUF427 domain-containing protein [Candidatus Kutchimonas denitrificans]NIR99958.1 DUF427 domain-containing protein [Gemmatimonadota bacterium]NIT65542.1 DUF427 domain-containing protein [Gemmatimonadota bacterium]NIU52512.1 DUF427 domain-containing protein [Gemmatimonadota bacterium]
MNDLPPGIQRLREKWNYRGDRRPDFAEEPGPGQESVWDYPRPPRVEPDARLVRVVCAGTSIAETRNTFRVLETASPPAFYLPPDDVRMEHLEPADRSSLCEWKGRARYWSVWVGDTEVSEAAWGYPEPWAGYEAIAGHVSFYPGRVECYVDGERVKPQGGDFYGGWVTWEIIGPWKGEPGTQSW